VEKESQSIRTELPVLKTLDKSLQKVLVLAGHLGDQESLEVYLVGGVVRDMLLQRIITDIDIMVVGNGIQFAKKFAKTLNVKNIISYSRFGTAMIPYKYFQIEVSSARTEWYEPNSRKPEIEFCDLDTDLSRRDFTINTLATSLNSSNFWKLEDRYGAMLDLQNRSIRTPLDADKTFSDDPLRMMRAIRFATQLKFFIEPEILVSIRRMAERIEIVSWERIRDELAKILVTEKPSIGLELLEETGLMRLILPEISALKGVDAVGRYHHNDVFAHTLKVVDNVAKSSMLNDDGMVLRWAALFHDIAKPKTKRFKKGVGWTFYWHDELGAQMIPKLFRRLKLPNILAKKVETLVRMHLRPIQIATDGVTDSAVRRMMVDANDLIDLLIELCRSDITSKNPAKISRYRANFDRVASMVTDVQWKDKLRAFQSPISGEEIMKECDLKPSRLVGQIKHAIEEAILDGIIPFERDAAWNYLQKNKEEWLHKKNFPQRTDRLNRFKQIEEKT